VELVNIIDELYYEFAAQATVKLGLSGRSKEEIWKLAKEFVLDPKPFRPALQPLVDRLVEIAHRMGLSHAELDLAISTIFTRNQIAFNADRYRRAVERVANETDKRREA
jgi:hypothetical protein